MGGGGGCLAGQARHGLKGGALLAKLKVRVWFPGHIDHREKLVKMGRCGRGGEGSLKGIETSSSLSLSLCSGEYYSAAVGVRALPGL